MFDFDKSINKVANPLKINKNSIIEFNAGFLAGTGIYRFKKIIEVKVRERKYSRYVIYSQVDNTEFIIEAFPDNSFLETYVYRLKDQIPFSEDFLFNVTGQRYLTTPDGFEYQRTVMPNSEERIDGVSATFKVFDVGTNEIEYSYLAKLWDYQLDNNGLIEYLCVEMSEKDGIFKIFAGELLEEIFYKIYKNT